jgi:hypothetical protein
MSCQTQINPAAASFEMAFDILQFLAVVAADVGLAMISTRPAVSGASTPDKTGAVCSESITRNPCSLAATLCA